MKKILQVIILLAILAFGLNAVTISNTINFSYKLRREVEEDILNYYFSSDTAGSERITTKELDTTVGLSVPQVYIFGTTNWTRPYLVVLTFTKMTWSGDGTTKYPYDARILTNPDNSSEYADVLFSASSDEADVTFNGGNSDSSGEEESFSYPVSFSFDELPAGSFSGTIRLEVIPE